MQVINVSIDLNKIDKTKIVNHKNGAKYYSLDIIVNDTPNNYGQDVSVKNAQSKEERAARTPSVYIGNGKVVYQRDPEPMVKSNNVPPPISEQENDSLPF